MTSRNCGFFCHLLCHSNHFFSSSFFFCSVSMENINTDIHELERGMELTKREAVLRKDSRDYPALLKDFLPNAEDKFKKIVSDVKTAQVN